MKAKVSDLPHLFKVICIRLSLSVVIQIEGVPRSFDRCCGPCAEAVVWLLHIRAGFSFVDE